MQLYKNYISSFSFSLSHTPHTQFSYLYRHASHSHLPPHIFAIAGSAYQSMVRDGQNQCCVVSGESGAGKTEASNLLVQQFMRLGRAKTRSLEEKILKVCMNACNWGCNIYILQSYINYIKCWLMHCFCKSFNIFN